MRQVLAELIKRAVQTDMQHAIIQKPVGMKAEEELRELSLQGMFATALFVTHTLNMPPVDFLSRPPDCLTSLATEAELTNYRMS